MLGNVRRLAWLGAAAVLSVAGAVAVLVAARESELGERHGRLALTIAAGLLCGAVAVVGARLLERRQLMLYALATLVLAAASFALITVAIWNDDIVGERYGKPLLTALLLIVSPLVVSTLRLLVDRRLRPVWLIFGTVVTLVAAADLLAVVGIWRTAPEEAGESDLVDDGTRALVALFGLTVVGYLAAPLVQRGLIGRSRREDGEP